MQAVHDSAFSRAKSDVCRTWNAAPQLEQLLDEQAFKIEWLSEAQRIPLVRTPILRSVNRERHLRSKHAKHLCAGRIAGAEKHLLFVSERSDSSEAFVRTKDGQRKLILGTEPRFDVRDLVCFSGQLAGFFRHALF